MASDRQRFCPRHRRLRLTGRDGGNREILAGMLASVLVVCAAAAGKPMLQLLESALHDVQRRQNSTNRNLGGKFFLLTVE